MTSDRAASQSTASPAVPTLALLVDRMNPALLQVVVAPHGLDVPIADPVIHDPAEQTPPAVGSVLLAVGADTDHAIVAMFQQLADARVSAVVVKRSKPVGAAVIAAAEEAGIALLAAPTELSWGRLYTMALTAVTSWSGDDAPQAPLGDLFALVNAVAAMVGGATTIEDPESRVLAYSSLDHQIDLPRQQTILGRQVPGDWMSRLHEAGVFRRLWQTDEVVRIDRTIVEEPGYLDRIAIAVRAGGELLGSIWVIEGAQPLGADAERTLTEAADIAALHLVRHRTARDVERHRRAEELLAVLEGRAGSRASSVLELTPERAVTVVAFDVGDVDGHAPTAETVLRTQRVADLVAVYCESYRRQATCVAAGSRAYALVPDSSGGDDHLLALARSIVTRAGEALHAPLRAGIGSTVIGTDGVVSSRRDADRVLDVIIDTPHSPEVARMSDIHAQAILWQLRKLSATEPALRTGKLVAMVEQDATKGTAWVATLRAYFDAFGDMGTAAGAVHIHPNTFRYRIRRITEIFDLDLNDADERLVTELQLRFLDDAR